MVPSLERDTKIFQNKPTLAEINKELFEKLSTLGATTEQTRKKVTELTGIVLNKEERKKVDKNIEEVKERILAKMEIYKIKKSELEKDHIDNIGFAITTAGKGEPEDYDYKLAA